MKFSCTQENLSRGVQMVSHIAAKNTNLPILHNIYVDAKDDGVELVATNLEIGIRVFVRGKVEEPGVFTVPGHILANYIGLVSGERVDIAQEGVDLLIHAGNQKTKIRGESAAEFPLIPDVTASEPVKVVIQSFREALSQALIAPSRDDSRPELTGVYFAITEKELILAATDSYRLAEAKIALQGGSQKREVIIPATALMELVRVLPVESEEQMSIHCSDNQVLFKTPEVELTTRIIEGNFPDYTQIIPTDARTAVIVEKDAFVKAVKAASLFSKSGIHDVSIHLSPEKQTITLTSVNNQIGENISTVEAEITGDSNNTIFNYRYLLDGVANIPTQKVRMQLVDNVTPGVFLPHGGEHAFTYIIMPIKQ